jgi:hypothetical protein
LKRRCAAAHRQRASKLLHAQRREERKARGRLCAHRETHGRKDSLLSIVRLRPPTTRLKSVARRRLRPPPG